MFKAFKIIKSKPSYTIPALRGRLIDDIPIIDTFPVQGAYYYISRKINADIVEMKQLLNYDNPVTTWYFKMNGEILDIQLKVIGSIEYEIEMFNKNSFRNIKVVDMCNLDRKC